MTEILNYFPGMQVTLFQPVTDGYGQRTDGYAPPIITRIIFPGFTLATGFPQTMHRLDIGLFYFQFVLPKGAGAIGSYEAEVFFQNPTTGLPNFKYFQVNVTAPFGSNTITVPSIPCCITPVPGPPGPTGPAGGDLAGFYPDPTVVGLQGQPISNVLPTLGQVLTWNGTAWTPLPGAFNIAGGDLSGTYPNPTVVALQTNPIASGVLTSAQDGYVLTWKNSDGKLEFLPTSNEIINLNGDVVGTTFSNTVTKLQGNPISTIAATAGQFLIEGVPATGSAWTTLSGDISNSILIAGKLTVIGLQNVPVATTTPVQSAVPVFDTNVSEYDIRKLTLDDLGPAFAITSFTGGSTVEVGATVTNPTFNATYSSPANSAQITNTDGIDSPLVLITPFTSGTVVGSFMHNTITSVTFTLTAVAATTKTANQSISYLGRTFSGLGTGGATSATASGNNATLVGASGTLTGSGSFGGLFGSIVGQSFGLFTPVGQKIYLLTPHTGSPHVFKDQDGFSFVFNSPTTFSFTNQQGAILSYDIYESTNFLSTNFTITVVS